MRAHGLFALVTLAALGCYDAHGTIDGGGLDGRIPRDAGPCRTPSGVLTCGTLECPITNCDPGVSVDIGIDVGVCRWPSSGSIGICRFDLNAAGLERPCRRDGISQPILFYPPNSVFTYCGADGLCDDFRTLGFTAEEAACYYSDGSPYVSGAVPAVDCTGLSGACGYGCAPCPAGQACFGPSEQSGLGVCVPTYMDRWGHELISTGELFECGMVGGRLLECPISDGCLTFLVTDRLEGWERGRCVELTTCEGLAAAHPERYRCDPDG